MIITVSDTGVGLLPENLCKIFAEGVQFNANELQAGQGSGLGLFITKGIVELHQGLISVKSDGIDKGSSFTVELPVVKMKSRRVVENQNDCGVDIEQGIKDNLILPPSDRLSTPLSAVMSYSNTDSPKKRGLL